MSFVLERRCRQTFAKNNQRLQDIEADGKRPNIVY